MEATASISDSDRFAIDFINNHYQDDLKSLKSLKDVFTEQKELKISLEKQVIIDQKQE